MRKFLYILIIGHFVLLSMDLCAQINKMSYNQNIQALNKNKQTSIKQPIRALLIGINRPEDTKENKVSSSIKDIQELSKVLKSRNSKSYVKTLLNEKATSKEILDQIDNIIIKGDTSYTRLIYIASHGSKIGMCPYSINGLEYILWNQINEKLKLCKASKKIILVMTCESTAIAKSVNNPDLSWCYLTSSKSFENSFGRNGTKNSEVLTTLFCESFISSLNKSNLILKIYESMISTFKEKEKEEQTPQLNGNKKLRLDF